MENTETIFFDESGTPAVSLEEGLFIIGGFSIRGDVSQKLDKWLEFLDKNNLHGKKGKKYTKNDFLNLSDFMCKHNIIPITSHSRLSIEDVKFLKHKIQIHNDEAFKRNKEHMVINPNEYFWSMQVAITLGTSILSLILNRGKISKANVAVHQYLKKERLQKIVESVLRNTFGKDRMEQIFSRLIAKLPNEKDIAGFLRGFTQEEVFIELDWNLRGKLGILADAVCSLYRRKLKGESGIHPSWDVLKICYKKDGKIPYCIGSDLTSAMKRVLQKPWID